MESLRDKDALLDALKHEHETTQEVLCDNCEPQVTEVLCDNCGECISRPKMGDIKKAVAEYFEVSRVDLESPRRTQPLTRARQIAMYLCRQMTARSYPEIGRFFGGRDHTTALHANDKITGLVRSDWTVAYDVAQLERRI
jgi:chromosomal replication initiation ATPase DnaA